MSLRLNGCENEIIESVENKFIFYSIQNRNNDSFVFPIRICISIYSI